MLSIFLSQCRINGADVQVTQGISQSTSSNIMSLVDDMLQSQRMTIEDLMDASDVIDKCQKVVIQMKI